jgi:peptidoglycan/LPS O-acetylase OafA/YrhL
LLTALKSARARTHWFGLRLSSSLTGQSETKGEAAPAKAVYRGHIPELDAFRAFGVTIVVLNHMWPEESSRVWNLLHLAWFLMDVFFVMSGFLIAGILLDSRNRPDYYRSFYVRRVLRIFPLYYVVIGAVTAVLLFLNTPAFAHMLRTWGSPAWFFFYMGNLPTALTGQWPMAGEESFVPLWSLQIEEQFYLLFPLLVHRVGIETLKRVLWAFVAVSPLFRIVIWAWDPGNVLAQYVLLPCRMEGLAFGALIAIRFRAGAWNLSRKRVTVLAVLWLAATLLTAYWDGSYHTGPFNRMFGFLLSPIASAYIVLWLILFRGSRLTACLRFDFVQYLGKISYGIYMLHWPMAGVLAAVSTALGVTALSHGFPRLIAVCAMTLACASLSWWYMESPLLRLKDRFSPARPPRERGAAPLPLGTAASATSGLLPQRESREILLPKQG